MPPFMLATRVLHLHDCKSTSNPQIVSQKMFRFRLEVRTPLLPSQLWISNFNEMVDLQSCKFSIC